MSVVVFVSHCMGRRRQQFAWFNYTMIRDNFIAPGVDGLTAGPGNGANDP